VVPESYRKIYRIMFTGLDEGTKLQSIKSIDVKILMNDLPTLSWEVEDKLRVGDWMAALQEYKKDKVYLKFISLQTQMLMFEKVTPVPVAPVTQLGNDLVDIESSIRSFRYRVESSRRKVAIATSAMTVERDNALRVDESLRTIIDKIRRD
jgi:hypothetical protein